MQDDIIWTTIMHRGVGCRTNPTRRGEWEGDTSTNDGLLRKVLNVIQRPKTKEPG